MSAQKLFCAQDELLEAELVIFVLSTTGNGTAPPSFVPLWQALLHPQLPADILDHLRCAIIVIACQK